MMRESVRRSRATARRPRSRPIINSCCSSSARRSSKTLMPSAYRKTPLGAGSDLELAHELGILLQIFDWVVGVLFLLDKVLLQRGGRVEDGLVIDRSFPHDHVLEFAVGLLHQVLHMGQREALGRPAEVFDRVMSAGDHPTAIHLEHD